MARITARILGTISASALGAILGLVPFTAPAQAASRDGICDAGEFCYYFGSAQAGSLSDHLGSLPDYGSTQPGCYEYKSAGSGQDQCVKNNAASGWNRTSETSGSTTTRLQRLPRLPDFAPGVKANLNSTLIRNTPHTS